MESEVERDSRRTFLGAASTTAMGVGVAASYGTLGVIAGKYLYSPADAELTWQYVAVIEQMAVGDAIPFVAPSGIRVVVARQGAGAEPDDFIALSSVCPHLGCQVHWEQARERFFCPCHNGAFDRQGNATEGPPAKAHQKLLRFPLKVENGLLFVEVPLVNVNNA